MKYIITTLLFSIFFCSWINGEDTSGLLDNRSADEKGIILTTHLKNSIALAEAGISKLSPGVLEIPGMSSPKGRHLLNNLCSLQGANYLEIGVWKGSTWISALYMNNNNIRSAIGIDNWSQAGGPYIEFQANCNQFISETKSLFYSVDSFHIDKQTTFNNPVNIYFYDGLHTDLAQELAFTYYNDVLDNVFIAIVDDWYFPEVQIGTRNAFEKLNYEVLYEQVLPALYHGDIENWWHGMYVAVIRKQ